MAAGPAPHPEEALKPIGTPARQIADLTGTSGQHAPNHLPLPCYERIPRLSEALIGEPVGGDRLGLGDRCLSSSR